MPDNTNNNDANNSSSGEIFYDLQRDDGRLKAKTAKEIEIELEAKEKKRKQEVLLAHDRAFVNKEKIPEEPKKTAEKEENKEASKEKVENNAKNMKPVKEFQEVKLNQQNMQENKGSTTRIQGIDAEIQDRIKQKKKLRKDTSSAITDAGSAGEIRSPSPTPAVNKSPSQGIRK